MSHAKAALFGLEMRLQSNGGQAIIDIKGQNQAEQGEYKHATLAMTLLLLFS